MRRNMRSVASYTAQRTKDLLAFQPAEDTNSLDQVMYPSERTVAESRASLQSHTTSIEERGGGMCKIAVNHTNTTGSYISSNHDRTLARLKLVQNPITLVLLLVAMDSYMMSVRVDLAWMATLT